MSPLEQEVRSLRRSVRLLSLGFVAICSLGLMAAIQDSQPRDAVFRSIKASSLEIRAEGSDKTLIELGTYQPEKEPLTGLIEIHATNGSYARILHDQLAFFEGRKAKALYHSGSLVLWGDQKRSAVVGPEGLTVSGGLGEDRGPVSHLGATSLTIAGKVVDTWR